ncbi:MAG: hypothetical protein L0212_04115 [Acidobacteria bacterium]|nr:hypothetical protein [Acidobacteriota bacterium]
MLGQTQSWIEEAQVLNVGNQLRESRRRLTELTQLALRHPAVARAVTSTSPTLNDLEREHQWLVKQYNLVHRAVFGTVAEGIAGVWIPVAIAATLVLIASAVLILLSREQRLKAQADAARAVEGNRTVLLAEAAQKEQQAQVAAQRGDVEEARRLAAEATRLREQAGPPGSPPPGGSEDLSAWIQRNWPWLALVVGAVYVAPTVVETVFD